MAATLGSGTSGEQVATMTRSTSDGSRPEAASAFAPAASAMSVTVSSSRATRRDWMPTRDLIQLVAGVDDLGQVVVGDDPVRLVTTETEDLGLGPLAHEATSLALGVRIRGRGALAEARS